MSQVNYRTLALLRRNILILGHNYATQFIDIYNQYTRLFHKDHCEVTVAFLTGSPDEEVRKRSLAENVIFLNQSKKNIRTLKIKAIKQLLTLCRQKQFQTVICHRYKPTYILLWVSQLCRIPALIFVMHELRTMSAFGRRLLVTLLARKNMLFAGVSNVVRDDLRKSLPRIHKERIITLYNMIDVDITEPQLLTRDEARAALGLNPLEFVFGNLARLAPNKDQENLIKAFSLIKPYCPNAKLVIAGDGDLEHKLKAQVIELALTNDIIFTGFLPAGFRYMKAFDCFVLTSTQEAFGRVLLEAMIAKLPIIATKVHGIPEVVGNCGTLIKAKDSVALASALKEVYLLSLEELNERGTKAYQHAISNFAIPTFYEQFWQLPLLANLKD